MLQAFKLRVMKIAVLNLKTPHIHALSMPIWERGGDLNL